MLFRSSTLGALPWSIALVYAGMQLGANWVEIREILRPFDLAIFIAVIVVFLLLVWWRMGMPGLRRKDVPAEPEAKPGDGA